MRKSFKHPLLFIISLMIAGSIMRLYNLNWGAPFYFHPDERNIASAVSQLQFPSQMNPHFFAYGALPIYTVFFVDLFLNFFSNCISVNHWQFTLQHSLCSTSVTFEQAIISLRVMASLCSISLIPVIYLIGKKIQNQTIGIIASFLTTVSVGFIQFAHFGTYEIWLTFFTSLFFLTCLLYIQHPKRTYILWMSIFAGILISSKITMLVLLPIPVILVFLTPRSSYVHFFLPDLIRYWFLTIRSFLFSILFLLIVCCVFVVTNPFVFNFHSVQHKSILSLLRNKTLFTNEVNQDFIGSMNYESSVALGTEPVFYTGEFYQTQPIIFQFLHVYPFLLNPLLTIIFIPSIFYILFKILMSREVYKNSHLKYRISFCYVLIPVFFILLFFSQAYFYVKWVRYMIPTLPFMYLAIAVFASDVLVFAKQSSMPKLLLHIKQLYSLIFLYSLLFTVSYVTVAYIEPDTRITAVNVTKNLFTTNAPLVSEVYDLGITPFNPYFSNIKLFNFYDLDNKSSQSNMITLTQALQHSDGIILPSQRILKVRLLNKKQFPVGNSFYSQLFTHRLPFHLVYETGCDIFCEIVYLGNPIFSYEETASVFDRPALFIFKRDN